MIVDIQSYLIADAQLAALLNPDGNTTNPKVFLLHEITGRETDPFLRLSYVHDGTADDIVDECVIQASIVVSEPGGGYSLAKKIEMRLTQLLDVYDQFRIPSVDYLFKYSKKIGGADRWEEDTRTHHLARMYRVISKRVQGG